MSKNKKKLGYTQYEDLLAQAHQRIEFLASKYQEMQAYFIAYVEFNGHNVEFNGWLNKRLENAKKEGHKEERSMANEKV